MVKTSSNRELPEPSTGVICAFELGRARCQELSKGELETALENRTPVWVHCNIGHSGLVAWLSGREVLPPEAFPVIVEREIRHRLEFHRGGFLMVSSDFLFEEDADPAEVAPIWIWVSPTVVLTARLHPLRTTDCLRVMARRNGLPSGSMTFFVEFLQRQLESVERLSHGVGIELERIEDQILKERILTGRAQLGNLRRHSTALRRHFRPLVLLLQRLSARPPEWIRESQSNDLKTLVEDLSYLVEESSHQLDAAKLLQEELSARDAESTGRNLYVLTIYTAAFLPMTLISGIFGMNLPGIPWSGNPGGFWWVIAMILASGFSVLLVSFRRFL
jgi:zinc transporter